MEVAVRDNALKQTGASTGIEGLRQLGLDLVELAIDREGNVRSLATEATLNLATREGLAALQEELSRHGVRVCALLCSQDFNAREEREAHIRWVVRAVQAAEALGAPAVRIDSAMTGQAELPLEERVAIYADAVRQVLAATPDSAVALGIENHGRQGNDPEWMRRVIEAVGHPRLGLTLDVGNWYWYGHPLSRVYAIYREFGPRVKATHVKNIRYPEEMREVQRPIGYEYGRYVSPLDEGDIDMRRVVEILREAGYTGALTIEDESLGKYPPEERGAILRRDVEHLRAALAG